jgi:alkylation response protein AidB-like acyl-CoA dehydrogenase
MLTHPSPHGADLQAEAARSIENLLDVGWPSLPAELAFVLDKASTAAEAGDAAGRIDEGVLAAVRSSGFLGLPIPNEFEGGGGGALETAAILRRLAIDDPGLAIGLNMHLFSVAVLVEHWRLARDKSWILLEAIAGQQRLVASAFGEPGLNGSILRSKCLGRPVAGGYRVSGVKAPCSLIGRSDLVCLQFEAEADEPDTGLKIAMLPTDATGLRVERTWDAVGMRASESDTLIVEDCFIPNDLVFFSGAPGRENSDLFAKSLAWFCLGIGAVYCGLMRRALSEVHADFSSSEVRKLKRYAPSAFRVRLGEQVQDFLLVEDSLRSLAGLIDADRFDRVAGLNFALAVRSRVAEVAPSVVAECSRLAGAGTLARSAPMSRLLRDVLAVGFHPPSPTVAASMVAQQFMGDAYALDLD